MINETASLRFYSAKLHFARSIPTKLTCAEIFSSFAKTARIEQLLERQVRARNYLLFVERLEGRITLQPFLIILFRFQAFFIPWFWISCRLVRYYLTKWRWWMKQLLCVPTQRNLHFACSIPTKLTCADKRYTMLHQRRKHNCRYLYEMSRSCHFWCSEVYLYNNAVLIEYYSLHVYSRRRRQWKSDASFVSFVVSTQWNAIMQPVSMCSTNIILPVLLNVMRFIKCAHEHVWRLQVEVL